MKLKILLGMCALFISSSVFAFQTKITDTYVFGDGDSKASVKEVLLERMKRDAANQAGTYIQSDKTINSSGYKESIKTISASIVKLKILSEKTGLNKDGSFYLRITADANIDDKELRNRISAIQADKGKDKLIKSLSKEKESLLKQMAKLENALKDKSLTSQKVSEILADQSEITRQLSDNDSAVSKIFKRGTLLSLAGKSKEKSESVVREFSKEYARYWDKHSRNLNPVVESVTEMGKGYEVAIKIPLSKYMMGEMYHLVTGKRADKFKPRNGLILDYFGMRDFNRTDQDKALSIAEYLSKQKNISLTVKLGGKTQKLEFFGYFRKGFFSSDAYEKISNMNYKEFRGAVISDGYSKEIIAFNVERPYEDKHWKREGNDIIMFFNLSKEQAESADKVTAYFK